MLSREVRRTKRLLQEKQHLDSPQTGIIFEIAPEQELIQTHTHTLTIPDSCELFLHSYAKKNSFSDGSTHTTDPSLPHLPPKEGMKTANITFATLPAEEVAAGGGLTGR